MFLLFGDIVDVSSVIYVCHTL